MSLQVEDYFEIHGLLHSYPFLLDKGDFDGLGDLFSDAKMYNGSQLFADRNREQAISAFRNWLYIYDDGSPRTRHFIANVIIKPETDKRVVVSSYVMVFQETTDLPLQPIVGGDYRDTMEKVNGKWRFVERYVGTDLVGDLRAHGRNLGVIRRARANG